MSRADVCVWVGSIFFSCSAAFAVAGTAHAIAPPPTCSVQEKISVTGNIEPESKELPRVERCALEGTVYAIRSGQEKGSQKTGAAFANAVVVACGDVARTGTGHCLVVWADVNGDTKTMRVPVGSDGSDVMTYTEGGVQQRKTFSSLLKDARDARIRYAAKAVEANRVSPESFTPEAQMQIAKYFSDEASESLPPELRGQNMSLASLEAIAADDKNPYAAKVRTAIKNIQLSNSLRENAALWSERPKPTVDLPPPPEPWIAPQAFRFPDVKNDGSDPLPMHLRDQGGWDDFFRDIKPSWLPTAPTLTESIQTLSETQAALRESMQFETSWFPTLPTANEAGNWLRELQSGTPSWSEIQSGWSQIRPPEVQMSVQINPQNLPSVPSWSEVQDSKVNVSIQFNKPSWLSTSNIPSLSEVWSGVKSLRNFNCWAAEWLGDPPCP